MAINVEKGLDLGDTVTDIVPEVTALRHELHEHPEIRFEERWTSDRIAAFLDSAGIAYERGYAKGTGIVARLEGGTGKTVALRADIDALEIEEQTGLPYASKIPRRMHACGHDGHTACLCGVVKTLLRHKDALAGTVKFIFQPAEEIAGGGKYIVDEGVLDDVDAAFALHGWPTLPVGHVGVKSGPALAAATDFHIHVKGQGCHGAQPSAGVDPVMVAAHITTALQTIVSREVSPVDPAVVTVGQIDGGVATNIIPEGAWLRGTFRSLNEKVHGQIQCAIPRIAERTAQAFRASAEVTFSEIPYPLLVNDEGMTDLVRETAQTVLDKEVVSDMKHPTMGAEDFAFYLQKVPGSFFFLGVNPDPATPYPPLHNPRYDFTDAAIPTAIKTMAAVALRFLAK